MAPPENERRLSPQLAGQLVFLGTGTSTGVPLVGCSCAVCRSGDPRNSRTRCSLVLGLPGGNLLVDTTPDLRSQLLRERIEIIHAIVYTHEHADHLYGLDDTRIFPYYLGHPVPLYCADDVEERIRRVFDYAFQANPKATHPGGLPQLEFRRIELAPFEVLGIEVLPIPLVHGRFRTLGFRFGNVAYCTDTNGIPAESWPLLQNLDVLVLDALRYTPHPTHFNLDEAIAVAQRIGARRTLFTHMAHEIDHAIVSASLPPGMELAYDGLRVGLT